MSSLPLDADRQPTRINDFLAGAAGKDRYARLLEFAERQIRSRRWCICTSDQSMPGGKTPGDLVNETLRDVLAEPEDEHRRNIPENVEIEHGLKCIMESKASNASLNFENRQRRDHRGTNRAGDAVDHLDTATPFWDPGTAELADDELAVLAQDCTRFIEFARKDRHVHAILVLVRDRGIDKPVELIAKELGLSVADVYLARKRLRTLVRKFNKTEARP